MFDKLKGIVTRLYTGNTAVIAKPGQKIILSDWEAADQRNKLMDVDLDEARVIVAEQMLKRNQESTSGVTGDKVPAETSPERAEAVNKLIGKLQETDDEETIPPAEDEMPREEETHGIV